MFSVATHPLSRIFCNHASTEPRGALSLVSSDLGIPAMAMASAHWFLSRCSEEAGGLGERDGVKGDGGIWSILCASPRISPGKKYGPRESEMPLPSQKNVWFPIFIRSATIPSRASSLPSLPPSSQSEARQEETAVVVVMTVPLQDPAEWEAKVVTYFSEFEIWTLRVCVRARKLGRRKAVSDWPPRLPTPILPVCLVPSGLGLEEIRRPGVVLQPRESREVHLLVERQLSELI